MDGRSCGEADAVQMESARHPALAVVVVTGR